MNKHTFHEIFNKLFEIEGISQGKLAGNTGLQQPSIGRMLSGETKNPGLGKVQKLAAHYNITTLQMLGEEPIQGLFDNKDGGVNICTAPSENNAAPPPPYDRDILYNVIREVAKGMDEEHIELDPDRLAEEITTVYEIWLRIPEANAENVFSIAEYMRNKQGKS